MSDESKSDNKSDQTMEIDTLLGSESGIKTRLSKTTRKLDKIEMKTHYINVDEAKNLVKNC